MQGGGQRQLEGKQCGEEAFVPGVASGRPLALEAASLRPLPTHCRISPTPGRKTSTSPFLWLLLLLLVLLPSLPLPALAIAASAFCTPSAAARSTPQRSPRAGAPT